MTRRVTVRGIVLHEGKLLCARFKPYKDHLKRKNSYWRLPGGGLDEGETLVAGVEREMIEEIGFIGPVATHVLPDFLKTEPLSGHAASNSTVKIISRL